MINAVTSDSFTAFAPIPPPFLSIPHSPKPEPFLYSFLASLRLSPMAPSFLKPLAALLLVPCFAILAAAEMSWLVSNLALRRL